MSHFKRFGPALLAILLVALLSSNAFAATAMSDHGSAAAQLGDVLFVVLPDGDNRTLYSIPAAGGDLTQLESRATLDDLVVAEGNIYYLRSDGGVTQLVKMDATAQRTVLVQFESGESVSHLSYYDQLLYCLLDGGLILIDPATGDYNTLGDEAMTEYAIVSDVIFFISATDTASYERTMSDGAELSTASGKLYSMSILGTNPEVIVEKGVADLKAYDDNLFFHNLEDNYVMESSATKRWLEGKLYRYNIQTGQMTSMNMDYDWAFYPTEQGLVTYTSQNISLYPLTGGDGEMLMAPEAYTSLTVMGDAAYVYEHTAQLLTRLPLDGGDQVALNPNGQVIIDPNADDSPLDNGDIDAPDDETGDDANGEDAGDDEGDAEDDKKTASSSSSSNSGKSSGYIFPNSSTKKLTRAQILKVDKNKWGYARNEIYARHGYVFKKSKYKDYFENKTWYKPGGFSTKDLNSIEWYNMELIKDMEQEYGLLSGGSKGDGGSSSGSSSGTSGGYLLPNARTKKYTEKSLKKALGGDTSLLGYARNEILARHGYVFKTAKYKNYFKKKSWYKAGGYSSSDLNNTEWHNIELIKKMEKKYN